MERLIDKRAGNNEFVTRKQQDHDNYETPAWVVESLIKRILPLDYTGTILEPCCGPGATLREIRRVLPLSTVVSSDIRNGEQIEGERCIDFLDFDSYEDKSFDWVITNPPFREAMKITLRALDVARKGVCIINRTNWVESISRYVKLWNVTPIKHIWTFVRRVNFYPEGEVSFEVSGMLCFAWFVWKHGHEGDPTFGWIADEPTMAHDTRLTEKHGDSHTVIGQSKLF